MLTVGDGDAGAGGGDRRMRPHNNQVLKCPRCDSLNTKFCYYNNYNLSQPRYFCKSCRRYWTKGGVLRNVPVGGGCRKNKRSKSSKSAVPDSSRESKSKNKSSSSESSGLTAATATATMDPAEEGSAPSNTTSNSSLVRDFPDATVFDVNPEANHSFDRQPLANQPSTGCEIFAAEIGSFSSLMTTSEEVMAFGISHDIPLTTSFEPVNQVPVVENNPVQAPADEFKLENTNDEGFASALDWGIAVADDQSQFDLTAGVDPSYWSQHQWTVYDQSLHYYP